MKPVPRSQKTGDLRASDADRERVVDTLRAAAADGRLTVAEHTERMERAYDARTLGELAQLTTDLLADPEAQPVRLEPGTVLGTFRKESRKGRWVVPERLRVLAVFGECHLDLCQALLSSKVTRVDALAQGGSVTIVVPAGVRVRLTGWAILGSRSARVPEPSDPDAPVLEVHCIVSAGSVRVRAPKRRGRWFRRSAPSDRA